FSGRSRRTPDREAARGVPVAGRQARDRLPGGAGAEPAALPDAALEPATMSRAAKSLGAVLLAALVYATPSVAEAQAPIRIGATVSQTGVYAADGQTLLRCYQLCVKHTNQTDGLLGRKLELVVYAAGSAPATAVRLYEKLISRDKVDLVLSPYNSAMTDPVANVTEKAGMAMVAPVASATSMYRKGRKLIFSVSPPPETWLEGLLDLAARKGLKTAAMIHSNDLGRPA